MCSRLAETQCSVCCRTLDKGTNRIIVEICGHQKCRECFIKEEEGCSVCKGNNSTQDDKSVEIESPENQNHEDDIDAVDEKLNAESNDETSHIIAVNEEGSSLSYRCTICHKTFKSRNNRKYHLFCDKNRSKPFRCEICDKQLITLAHLKYHQSTHDTDKRFACQHCDRIYSGDIALKKHLRKHQNDFKYECEQCNEKFIYKEQLNIHRNRHNDIFHECPECGKRFLIKSNFTKHIQSHSGLNRKTCQVCGNTFSGSSALKTHLLTHSKSKSHQCNRCEKKFIDHRTLERHMKTHSDEIAYECTLCPAKSNRKDNIRRHVRNLHSNSDEELRTILTKIIENFSKKQKTEKIDRVSQRSRDSEKVVERAKASKTNEQLTNVPKNNTTSVIKFAGRPNQQIETVIDPTEKSKTILNSLVRATHIEHEKLNGNEINPVCTDVIIDLPSLNYEPLNLDPFPEIAPLPPINTNTNLSVYRQLLSPYLKKSTNGACSSRTSRESTSSQNQSNEPSPKPPIVIDRPPKKMIEKYEIYRN